MAQDNDKIIDEINDLSVNILFVSLGDCTMGVDRSFDSVNGELKRASETIQRLGIEWLFRLYQVSEHIDKILNLPKFIATVLSFPSFLSSVYPKLSIPEITCLSVAYPLL